MYCVRKINLSLTKPMFDRGKTDNNCFGGYIYLCLPPYNTNFLYFEIKSLVPCASILGDSTVVVSMLHVCAFRNKIERPFSMALLIYPSKQKNRPGIFEAER